MTDENNMLLKFFADYIEKELGIVYAESNLYQLKSRLEEIAKNLQVPNVEQLYRIARNTGITGHFKQLLLDTATNNETLFFRDPRIFKAVEEKIIPDILEAQPDIPFIRFWSAACSFGQEPYSLAILNEEMKKKDPKTPRFLISASDISSKALAYAKKAQYSQLEVQRGLKTFMMVKYFKKNADSYWCLNPEIRLAVEYFTKNLLDLSSNKGQYDVIFCRNVLIYQPVERKKTIIENLANYLNPNGVLVLGSSESLVGISNSFDLINSNGTVYYKKKSE